MSRKQPKTPKARAYLVVSIASEMRSLAEDSPGKTFSIRYPGGGYRTIYTRLVALTGERGKWDALERVGLVLVEENGKPQAVKVMAAAKEEPARWNPKQ
jgi:hypothetical protein